VAIAAMAEGLGEIGTPIPFRRLICIGPEAMRRFEQRIPDGKETSFGGGVYLTRFNVRR